MTPSVRPAFLLSLPRSGSTFVQRVLATHPEVASAAEPWLQLQFLAPLADLEATAGPWHGQLSGAMRDFVGALPRGKADYQAVVRDASTALYARASPPGTKVFLDKTPPYHLIIDALAETFPDAPLLFLWRNPLSVLASVVETFEGGRWRVHRHRGDLMLGIENLVAGYLRHAERAVPVRYERLVTDDAAWEELARALGISYDPSLLRGFATTRFEGRMGDPTGVHLYTEVSTAPVDKWKQVLNTPVRQGWARQWLTWIGDERLRVMGYELDALLAELGEAPVARAGVLDDVRQTVEGATRDVAAQVTGRPRPASDLRLLLGRRRSAR